MVKISNHPKRAFRLTEGAAHAALHSEESQVINNVILRTESEESLTMRSFALALNSRQLRMTLEILPSPGGEGRVGVRPFFTLSRIGEGLKCTNQHPSQPSLIREGASYPLYLWVRGQAAFTLTEVLLAIVIVGVIAALVLPAMVTHFQERGFDQAYVRETKTLESAIQGLAVNENKSSFFETMMYSSAEPETYEDNAELFLKKYLRVSKICGDNNSDCFGKTYYQYIDSDKKVYNPEFKGSCASLKNGASICITPQVGAAPITGIIDLNGQKGPNIFGKDLRTFAFSSITQAGRNTEVAAVLDTDFAPIVTDEGGDEGGDEVDPCEGMTCGCGTLPECDPCEGKTCGCGDLPACLPTCSINPNDWDTTCCLLNSPSITSPTHHCCTYDDLKLMTKCQNTAKAIITLDCLSMVGQACIFSGTNLPLNGGGTFTASTKLFTQEMTPEAGSFNKVIHYNTGGLIDGHGTSGLQFAQITGSSTDAMCHSTTTLTSEYALTLELEYYVDGKGNFSSYSPSYKCY